MKQLLILGGGSSRNIEWGESCKEQFGELFHEVHFMHYDSWESGEENIDFRRELEKLKDLASEMSEGELYIFAKSIGTILTLKAVVGDIINPVKCVFFGMPFSVYEGDLSELSGFNVPSIAFHNMQDPLAIYSDTKRELETHFSIITLISKEGDTHKYNNFEDFTDEINGFLA